MYRSLSYRFHLRMQTTNQLTHHEYFEVYHITRVGLWLLYSLKTHKLAMPLSAYFTCRKKRSADFWRGCHKFRLLMYLNSFTTTIVPWLKSVSLDISQLYCKHCYCTISQDILLCGLYGGYTLKHVMVTMVCLIHYYVCDSGHFYLTELK